MTKAEERRARVLALREAGQTLEEIAETVGVSYETVRRDLRGSTRAQYARVRGKLVEQWADLTQAAAALGVQRDELEQRCAANQIAGAQRVGETWLIYRAALKKKGEKQG